MRKTMLSLLSAGVMVASCSQPQQDNPLLSEWNTPYGIPPFEQVQPEHYIPAYKAAMAAELAEIDEKFFDENPESVAMLLRTWLNDEY